ncbi:hypothetical protein CDAR_281271 [Caerostris darwini]|uniref:Uncharacterized protein n=1 Tax=Caerostris darwini TaxID=1538125 RepID=A0AAV4WYY0_9ARAC|nr:hypothetical protein CDAR_281271 [Caerostris darwini]
MRNSNHPEKIALNDYFLYRTTAYMVFKLHISFSNMANMFPRSRPVAIQINVHQKSASVQPQYPLQEGCQEVTGDTLESDEYEINGLEVRREHVLGRGQKGVFRVTRTAR